MIEKNFKAACQIFCDQQKEYPEIIGIIVSGSFIYGQIDKNSDIDIHLILDPTCTYRERGNTWINGVEIEYFKNPPQQIRSYFIKEQNSPHTADMLVNGQLWYESNPIVLALIEEAKNIIGELPKLPQPFQIELAKYHFDDLFKDLEDSQLKGDKLAVSLLKNQIVDLAIDWFCKLHQIRRTKHKRLGNQLERVDADFTKVMQMGTADNWQNTNTLSLLEKQINTLLGGKRPKEWVLKSGLDL